MPSLLPYSDQPRIFPKLALVASYRRNPRGEGGGREGSVRRQQEWRDLLKLLDYAVEAEHKGLAHPRCHAIADALPAAAFAVSAGELAWDEYHCDFTYTGNPGDVRTLACQAMALAITEAWRAHGDPYFMSALQAVRHLKGLPVAARWFEPTNGRK
jgi:hypothetical protein